MASLRGAALLGLALGATLTAAQDDMGTSSAYTDSATGIAFQGYTDPTGYRFGMVLPQSPTTDFVAQLISPLTQGAGWAGIDFGASMTGPMQIVAWPNGNNVVIAPRISTGYKVSDTVPYNGPGASSISITPIKAGTFVNSTHVVATFLCGGCMNSDSFSSSDAGKSGTVAIAYSSVAVSNPSDPNTQLSDHTTGSEPYGSIGFNFAEAQSSQYSTYAAMASSSGSGSSGNSANSTSGSSGASPTEAGAQAASDTAGSQTPAEENPLVQAPTFSAGFIVLLTGIGVVYMIQPFI